MQETQLIEEIITYFGENKRIFAAPDFIGSYSHPVYQK